MKPRHLSSLGLITLVSLVSRVPQIARAAAFQNLDFEAAQIVSPPSGLMGDALVSEALPGWSLRWAPQGFERDPGYGDNAQFVRYNTMYIDGPSALVVGPHHDGYRDPITYFPLSGSYSAGGASMQISQRGEIPAGRTGLVFETNFVPSNDWWAAYNWLRVTVNDSVLPIVPTGTPGQYRADISPWAGQEVVLAFSTGENPSLIDNISLVPEPSTWGFAFGLPLLVLGVLRARQRQIHPVPGTTLHTPR